MIVQELGRFGNSIEGVKPTNFINQIPKEWKDGHVGMFWHVGDGKWIVRSANVLDDELCSVEMGQEYDAEENPCDIQIGYAPFHNDVWTKEIVPKCLEWKKYHVDYFSRGRVIYEVEKQQFTIFVPRTERFHEKAILFLAEIFHLPKGSYQTERNIYIGKSDLRTLPTENFTVLELPKKK